MFEMGAHTMALPLEEKMKFEQGDEGGSFGYIDPSYSPLFIEKAQHLQVQVRRCERNRRQWRTRLGRVHQRFQGRRIGVPGCGAPQVSSYRGRTYG